jgi:ribosomal protein L11 methyltransferase
VNGWHAVRITVSPSAAEAIEFSFNELNALGTEIDQLRKTPADDLTVVGYFSECPELELVNGHIDYALSIYGLGRSVIRSITTDFVEKADWLAEWKRHWRPTRVGRFLIAPPWENVDITDGTLLIRIEPNMAFGTGTHETTKLCLKAIDERYRPEMSFLDVGTGTGILAIAAAKMPAADDMGHTSRRRESGRESSPKILAIELDPASVVIARENAAANGVAGEIVFVEGTLTNAVPVFDFVCANLTIDIITPMLPLLVKRFNNDLVLSGILAEQEDPIVNELSKLGASPQEVERDGEWISVLVQR